MHFYTLSTAPERASLRSAPQESTETAVVRSALTGARNPAPRQQTLKTQRKPAQNPAPSKIQGNRKVTWTRTA